MIGDPQAMESERLQLLPLGDQGSPGLLQANEETKLRRNDGHGVASVDERVADRADDARILRVAGAVVKP
jgi:hypothetical protein